MRIVFGFWLALIATAMSLPNSAMAQAGPAGAVGHSIDRICHDYTGQIVIEGQPRVVHGLACQQPDGSWQVLPTSKVPPPGIFASPAARTCVERIEPCDRGCDIQGYLGARHTHADCSRTCDLICGMREGYAAWPDYE